jgi:hypothetical protein
MKRFESGEALAKEMGLKPEVIKKTFDAYNVSAKTKNDPFGKKVCLTYMGPKTTLIDVDIIVLLDW